MTAPTMTPASAPVNEIGYQQAVGQYMWWLYENETTPELIWPQSVYVYDQMRRTDAQVGSVLRAVTLPVLRTPWRIDPAGARDEVVQLIADDLGLPIVGKNPDASPRKRDRFSWQDHLSEALLMLPIGYSYFEQVYRVDPDGSRAHLRKLALRPARTIEYVNVAQDGGLVSIKQYWIRSGERPQPIPVERLVAYIHAKEGGNWLGTSILRNCYKNWLLKDRLLRVQAQTIERNGMGIPLYKAQEGAADLSSGLAMAKGWRAGDAAGTAIPFGADLVLRGVEGTLPDAEPAIRYHDEQIARAVLAHFLNLGTQTGSWALGTTFADFFTLSLQTLAQQIADTATCHIIEDLVDINFGEDEPAPRLTFDEIGSRQAATAQALKLLIDVGVIHPDDILEESTRQQYGLPPRDPNAPPPGPLPGLMRETLTGPAPGGAAAPAPAVVDPKAVAAGAADEPVDEDLDAYDDDTDALAEALAAFAGEVTASEFDPIKHPRGPGGRFRSTFDKVMHALGEWAKGDGHNDPLPEKDFSRDQLRTVAKTRGITLKRGAAREDIAKAILDDLKIDVRTKRDNPPPKPSAKFTLKGEAHRNKDVAVFHEADGRVSLYEQSDSGVRGARVMTAPDLAGLEKWANDHGETELAAWARREGGLPEVAAPAPAKAIEKAALPKVPKAPITKRLRDVQTGDVVIWDGPGSSGEPLLGRVTREPGKGVMVDWSSGRRERITTVGLQRDNSVRVATPEEISKHGPIQPTIDAPTASKAAPDASPDLTGAGGLSDDPAVRQVQVDNRVREAYAKLAAKPGAWVGLADLRNQLGEDTNRHEVDASLKRLEQEPGANIVPESNQKTLTQADRDAAVVIGDQAKHALMIQDPSPRPLPGVEPVKTMPEAPSVPAGKTTPSWSGHDGLDVTDQEERDFLTLPGEKQDAILERIRTRTGRTMRDTNFGTLPDPRLAVSPEREAEIRAAVEAIAARKGPSFVMLQQIREGLGGQFDRAEVDHVFQKLNRSGDWLLSPEANQKVLTPRARLAAVTVGNADKHAIRVVKRGPEPSVRPLPRAAPATKAAPRAGTPAVKPATSTPEATLTDLRALGSHDEAWSAASKMTIPQLKATLTHMGYGQGLAGQRKGALVDRLAGTWPEMRVDAKQTAPVVPAVQSRPAATPPRTVADFTGDYSGRQASVAGHAGTAPASTTRLEGGISAGVELLTYPDGSRIVRKDYALGPDLKPNPPNAFGHVRADDEELAAPVLDAFKVPTPAVTRLDDHTIAMEYVDGAQGGASGVLTAPASVKNSDAGRLLGFADAVMGLRDRNGGGWKRVGAGIVPLDNGDAFGHTELAAHGNPFASYLMTSRGWKRDAALPVSADELAAIRTRLEALRPQFQRLNRLQNHKAMLARFDAITAHSKVRVSGRKRDLVDRLGEHLDGGAAPAKLFGFDGAGPAGGTDILGDYTAADMRLLHPKSIKMSQKSDNFLEDIAHRQGFDGKPKLGTAADLDAVIAAGGVELFRGVHAYPHIDENGELQSSAAPDLIRQFEDGPAFYGRAAEMGFGSGIYATPIQRAAATYGKVTRMVLDPHARIVTSDEMRRLAETTHFSDPAVAEHIGGNPGRLAAALGYDAIHDGKQYIVLNRTALHVESPRAPKRSGDGELAPGRSPTGRVPMTAQAARYQRDLAGIEDLARSAEGPHVDTRSLEASSSETSLVTSSDGIQLVRKVGDEDMTPIAGEQGGSWIARALGLDAPRVYRSDEHTVYMDHMDGTPAAVIRRQDWGGWKAREQEAAATDDGKLIGLLDQLITNQDRNPGNWLIRDDGRLVPIDHVAAFPLHPGEKADPAQWGPFGGNYVRYLGREPVYVDNDLTPADIAEARKRLETLRPRFTKIGKEYWLSYALDALDALEPHAKGSRDLIAGRPWTP